MAKQIHLQNWVQTKYHPISEQYSWVLKNRTINCVICINVISSVKFIRVVYFIRVLYSKTWRLGYKITVYTFVVCLYRPPTPWITNITILSRHFVWSFSLCADFLWNKQVLIFLIKIIRVSCDFLHCLIHCWERRVYIANFIY